MYISPFLFIATCLVPYVFAHGAPPSQEDSLTPHAPLRTREALQVAEVFDLYRRARLKAAPKPAKPAAKKTVAAVHKKQPVAAAALKKSAVTANVHKKSAVTANVHKKPAAAVQRQKVAASHSSHPVKPAAGANGKTAARPKAVGTKAAAKQSAAHGGACGRRVHRRSIYDDLYSRNDECEIHLNLQTHATKEMHAQTIKVSPSKNLGVNAAGIVSANNRAVYKIDKWHNQQGPFIAKQFLTDKDKSKEAGNLAKVGHLVAASPKNSPDDNAWAVMKHVPGKPLIGSPEHAAAMAKPKAEADAWMQQRHTQLANTVTKLHKDTGLLHADLKNDNVHWQHHADGSSTPHLLDFGQMASSEKDMKAVYRNNGIPADKHNVNDYALHRAQAIYPLKQ